MPTTATGAVDLEQMEEEPERVGSVHDAHILVCDAWGWQLELCVGLQTLSGLYPLEQASEATLGTVMQKLMQMEEARDRSAVRVTFLPTEVFVVAEQLVGQTLDMSHLKRLSKWEATFKPLEADVVLCPIHIPDHYFLAAIFHPGTASHVGPFQRRRPYQMQ